MNPKAYKIIGVGGIGAVVAGVLARYLNAQGRGGDTKPRLVLIDGDTVELRNFERQEFDELGKKASIKAGELARKFDLVSVRARSEYVTPANIHEMIEDGDVVFLCVDNHKTRKRVSDHCAGLQNVVLLSGGNDYTDGNIQAFIRADGATVPPTAPLTASHPEIADPKDKSPDEMSCEELAAAGAPQLIFTNLDAAVGLLRLFYRWEQGKTVPSEVYFDTLESKLNPVYRGGGEADDHTEGETALARALEALSERE